MGALTNLNSGSDLQIPPEVAMDSELVSAINAHLVAGDPHPQYLLDRLLPLLAHGLMGSAPGTPGSTTPFDANNWNPNSVGQAHKSALNVVEIGGGAGNLNLPMGSFSGTLIEIDPHVGSADQENKRKLQFFWHHNSSVIYWRRQVTNGWAAWTSPILVGSSNVFTQSQTFTGVVTIGVGGTPIRRLISQVFTINPPTLQAGDPWTVTLTMVGAQVGDLCIASITTVDQWNTGLWVSELKAVVSASNTVTLYIKNDWIAALDWAPFQVRVLVQGF
jgi:hypothetical protein